MFFLRPLIRYADFKGRARRAEYFGFLIFQMAVGGLFGGMAVISLTQNEPGAAPLGFLIGIALAVISVLAFAVPHLAVTVRRLHDTDRSAWWMLLQAPNTLAPLLFLGAIVGVAEHGGQGSEAAAAAFLAAAGSGLLLLAIGGICNAILMAILWIRGTEGENRFGPDPRSPDGRFNANTGESGGLDEARLDALFAEARQTSQGPSARDDRWKPDLEFGPMGGRSAVTPASAARSAWPDATPAPSFGRRRS